MHGRILIGFLFRQEGEADPAGIPPPEQVNYQQVEKPQPFP